MEYAKSMRDSSGEKYPISQGACSVVSSLTLAECSGGLAFGLKRCVEGAGESSKKFQIWEASWSLGGNYQIWEASWKLRGG